MNPEIMARKKSLDGLVSAMNEDEAKKIPGLQIKIEIPGLAELLAHIEKEQDGKNGVDAMSPEEENAGHEATENPDEEKSEHDLGGSESGALNNDTEGSGLAMQDGNPEDPFEKLLKEKKKGMGRGY